jgi:hypothetical protein
MGDLEGHQPTLGAIPLVPVPLSAAAMLPPIQEPCPFQSVFSGPPNLAARSASEAPKKVSHTGGFSSPVKSMTALTFEFSPRWVKSRPVSATPTVTARLPAVVRQPCGSPMRR